MYFLNAHNSSASIVCIRQKKKNQIQLHYNTKIYSYIFRSKFVWNFMRLPDLKMPSTNRDSTWIRNLFENKITSDSTTAVFLWSKFIELGALESLKVHILFWELYYYISLCRFGVRSGRSLLFAMALCLFVCLFNERILLYCRRAFACTKKMNEMKERKLGKMKWKWSWKQRNEIGWEIRSESKLNIYFE